MPQASLQVIQSPRLAEEELTAAQWAQLLDVTKKAFILRNVPTSGVVLANGGLTKKYRFADLPVDYQQKLDEQRRRQGCPVYGELLDLHRSPRYLPGRELATLPPTSQTLAEQRKLVLAVFWQSLERQHAVGVANAEARAAWLKMFGEACSYKTIQRWVAAIEQRGGPDLAPVEAYAGLKSEDGKSVPHPKARLIVRREIPHDLIGEYKARCVQEGMMHMQGAYRSLVIDWQNGRPVPGLGSAPERNTPFPFTARQLREFAPSRAARLKGGLGDAIAAKFGLPQGRQTTAYLRRMERVLLDDSRIDIIATDDLTGLPVELRCQFLMDLGPRRIESWVVREKNNIRAADTDAMIARALRSAGIAGKDAGYVTHIRFERGAVACSAARESFLLGSFPGQLFIDRTKMDGGKRNFGGAHVQSNSGRWMDKAHIESFMRTLAYSLQHILGQRGGNYARQPAALGLIGRNRAHGGVLDYTRGSQMHQGTLLQGAERAMALYEGDLDEKLADAVENEPLVNGRLKISALKPVRWVLDAIQEFVAWYNSRSDHRMEGFRDIEQQDPETLKLRHRKETPNERAAFLNECCPTERISEAAVSRLLLSSRPVTVTRNGVTMDIAPMKSLRFWKADSSLIHRAGRLTTGELKMVALVDEDAIVRGGPDVPREIYLIGNKELDFVLGQPAQFLESLPLVDWGDIGDPASLARSNAEKQLVQDRIAAELLHAAAPHIARKAAELDHNIGSMQAVTTANDRAVRAVSPDSPLITALANAQAGDDSAAGSAPSTPPTRGRQMANAAPSYLDKIKASLAKQKQPDA